MGPDFRTEPFPHQLKEFELHKESEARAMLWAPRTGKTKVIVDQACHLAVEWRIDGVLVIAPNGVHRNWIKRELPKHCWPSVPCSAMTWSTFLGSRQTPDRLSKMTRTERAEAATWERDFGMMLKSPDLAWLSVNSESVHLPEVKHAIQRFARARRQFMVVFDEAHYFRTPGSKWTHAAVAVGRRAAFRRVLTGTPIHNSPLHAYSIFELLAKGALGYTKFSDFEDHFATYRIQRLKSGRQFPALQGYRNMGQLTEAIARWSSLVQRSDVRGMSALAHQRREVGVSKEQLAAYRQLTDKYKLEIEGGADLTFVEAGARMIKLQQVLSGFVYDELGDLHGLGDSSPRLDALETEVELCTGQTIIWAQFREDCRRVAARLRKAGRRVCEYHGGVSAKAREEAIDGFVAGRFDDFVGQPVAGGTGLTLSVASDVIWYSHTPDNIVRSQAQERATSIGGDTVGVVDFAVPGSIDEYILDSILAGKSLLAGEVVGSALAEVLERCAL